MLNSLNQKYKSFKQSLSLKVKDENKKIVLPYIHTIQIHSFAQNFVMIFTFPKTKNALPSTCLLSLSSYSFSSCCNLSLSITLLSALSLIKKTNKFYFYFYLFGPSTLTGKNNTICQFQTPRRHKPSILYNVSSYDITMCIIL